MRSLHFFFTLVLVLALNGCSAYDRFKVTNPNYLDEATGQCSPNGSTGSFIDNDDNGLVDCQLFTGGMPVFLTATSDMANEKRRGYLFYLIQSKLIFWGNMSEDDLKKSINLCNGDLYIAPEGCVPGKLLPNPGEAAVWVTRDSDTGRHIQEDFDQTYKKKTPRRPEEAIWIQRRVEKVDVVNQKLTHLCTIPRAQKFLELQIVLFYDCDNDGRVDEYYSHTFPRAGEKQEGSTTWQVFRPNVNLMLGSRYVNPESKEGKEAQERFQEALRSKGGKEAP